MPDTKPSIRWNIVSKAENGLYYLEHIEVNFEDTGATIFTKVRQLCLRSTNNSSHRRRFLLHDPVVYTATVSNGKLDDTEAQVCEVFIKSKHYSEAYTLAIRDPTRLEKTFIGRVQPDAIQAAGQMVHALLVAYEIRRAKVVVMFGALSLLSFGIGLVVGAVTGKADIGIGVTAGLFQFLAILQWSYIWATRR